MSRFSLAQINAFPSGEFLRLFGPVFEHSPWVAEGAWALRPFESLDALHRAMCETVTGAGEMKQIDLILAHPDLVGRAALRGNLTPASTSEQSRAGLDNLTSDEIQNFQEWNAAYRKRFGFPFVICARLNRKQAILEAFPVRLQNPRGAEIMKALEEIFKIARLRLEDIVTP